MVADSSRPQISMKSKSAAEQERDRPRADFVNIERRVQHHTVFQVDDSSFISSMPRATHWSIAWSDLMMTMFVLFLSMFVYQSAHEEFLQKKEPEIIGGDTTEALRSIDSSLSPFPFTPISPDLPPTTAKKVTKVEQEHSPSAPSPAVSAGEKGEKAEVEIHSPENIALITPHNKPEHAAPELTVPIQRVEDNTEPLPIASTPAGVEKQNEFQEIYAISKTMLEDNNLGNFAAVNIVPDKTVRIILTSDLLFALGESTLSDKAKRFLKKIAAIILSIPYMINIVGHTDNIPMKSNRFKSNWELSVTRASAVARFLINEKGMDPAQFVVSGYSSYRPIAANTNADNRAKNRRVEIIISKRLPPPHPPADNNLKKQINEK